MRQRFNHLILVIPIFLLILSCATMQSRWKAAQSDDTIEAYEEFLRRYPEGELPDKARAILDSLYLEAQKAQARILSESLIAKFDVNAVEKGSITISPDCKRAAYVVKEGKKRFVVVDGKEGVRYHDISNLIFSPDGKRVAYVARDGRKRLVVVDDKEGVRYDDVTIPIFTQDGKVAYMAIEGINQFTVINGNEQREFESVAFSPDGERVAYVMKEGEQRLVVVDGKEGKKYDAISRLGFSPDSRRIAYVARSKRKKLKVVEEHVLWMSRKKTIETEEGEEEFVVVDGEEGKRYDAIGHITFSPDSRHIAYIISQGKKRFVVVDGNEDNKRYDAVEKPVFSPDSRRVAYVAFEGGRYAVLRTNPPYSGIAFVSKTTEVGTAVVVINGIEGKKYADVETPIFSPDSRHIAYIAGEGRKWIMVTDSRDMVRNVWLMSESEFAVVDGEEYKRYGAISHLSFSPDGKKLIYIAKKGKKWAVDIGDIQGKRYDYIVSMKTMNLENPEEIEYIAVSGNSIYLVRAKTE